MARVDIIQMLYSKDKNPLEFSFEKLIARPLLSLITPNDIYQLNKIATSIKLSSKPKEKYKIIDSILIPRGFKRIASGTNRVAYKFLDDNSICLKVALDKVGLRDNPREYMNQFLLQPFVTKVFEVSPCGTVGLFERVNPITSREEYLTVADSVFNLLTTILGKYVLDDIGTNYFQNIGVRNGFGVVLLDFPYVYELDGNKLFCNKVNPLTGIACGGEIDYDSGFNKIVCTKCGKQYYAKQLEKYKKDKLISVGKEGEKDMSIVIKKNNKILKRYDSEKNSDVLPAAPELPKIKIINPVTKEKDSNADANNHDIANASCDKNEPANSRISTNDYKGNVDKIYQNNDGDDMQVGDTQSCYNDDDNQSDYNVVQEIDNIRINPRQKNSDTVSQQPDVSDNY